MTQEEKQLLFKVLCAGLSYKLHCRVFKLNGDIKENDDILYGVIGDNVVTLKSDNDECLMYYQIKPYLRPMSSMTEEELNECVCLSGIKDIECPNWQDIPKEKQFEARLNHAIAVFLTDSNNIDWLNVHHFDYLGLIPMELALPATEDMYK